MDKLYIIDTITPFFRGLHGKNINWSKIPFYHLETADTLPAGKIAQILKDFEKYLNAVSPLGYNAIYLDDLAHLLTHSCYPDKLNHKLEQYRKMYLQIIQLCAAENQRIFINTDFFFSNIYIQQYLRKNKITPTEFFCELIKMLFEQYPQISGICIRIGESDGIDVKGDFKSDLALKKPSELNKLLLSLLPIFDHDRKTCILRVWSLGAYQLGDLLWNHHTVKKALQNCDTSNLILSIKHSPGDFFRYLEINPLFYNLPGVNKIIELQAKREYEGMGSFPAFIGWEYSKLLDLFNTDTDITGISVWAQTGGWSRDFYLTYLQYSSIWTELNVFTIISMFKHRHSIQNTINQFALIHNFDQPKLTEFLKLSDQVILNAMYIKEFAEKTSFFRRIRVPSLIWIFWNTIIINQSLSQLHLAYIKNPQLAINQGFKQLENIRKMQKLASDLGIAPQQMTYYYDTFNLFAHARALLLSPQNDSPQHHKLKSLYQQYKEQYPHRYNLDINLSKKNSRTFHFLISLLLRPDARYRMADHILASRLFSVIIKYIAKKHVSTHTSFIDKQAMPIETFLK